MGLGAIGSMVAQSADALGMKLVGYDPYISIDAAWRLPKEVQKANSIEELVGSSDFISIHVPLASTFCRQHFHPASHRPLFMTHARLL